ncbi:imidazole glycerol phosphate synthase subunit HisH [Henriciella marina]|uniref:Imidazole glycerol phosphate synthase subunit HisH n=1 Tax=Henriciella marina TaxID=453851 RepID=A0ABT4LTZ1_9PROT|nr:imidazole glycerol phosphate synthase subunit HisH [Henriciella marina]MCZ4296988.1 imidazole glycerol phosphate synthase subunit HisH [Henriciella marina]
MTELVLIDYGSGNLHSAERALNEAGKACPGSASVRVTDDPDAVRKADRIVLPGVGHFADCARGLFAREGLVEALNEAVMQRGVPFLGICVGLQLLATRGLEDGVTAGLDWIAGDVDRIEPGPGLKIPHMGWNGLEILRPHPILSDLGDDPHVYFTHSYSFRAKDAADVLAQTDYGTPLTAVIGRANMVATQFHPEKSQRVGLKLLANFLQWSPQ